MDLFEVKLKTGTKEPLTLKIWDFSKKIIQQPTHKYFLTPGAIYIITFNFTDVSHANLEYWFKIIKEYAGSHCVIILVGTHADLISEEETEKIMLDIRSNFPKLRYPAFEGDILPLNGKTGVYSKKLKELIISVAFKPAMRFSAAERSWVQLDELIRNNSATTDYIDSQTFIKWASSCSVKETDYDLVSDFLIKVGTFIRYSNLVDPLTGKTHEMYLIRPKWLINAVQILFDADNIAVLCGYVSTNSKAFDNVFPSTSRSLILSVLCKYGIIIYIKQQQRILVPCLLPSIGEHATLHKIFPTKIPDNTKCISRVYHFHQYPLDFFARAMVSVLRLPGANDLLSWKQGLIVCFHKIKETGETELAQKVYAFLTFNDDYEFGLHLRFAVNVNEFAIYQWRKIIESLRTMFESYYPRLLEMTDEYILCTHCMTFEKFQTQAYRFSYDETISGIIEGKTPKLCCSNIIAPSRFVSPNRAAPDIGLADIPRITPEHLSLSKPLGKGAFGTVYRGFLSGKEVAIKELTFSPVDKFVNKQIFIDFQIECYMMTKLNHVNIVKFYGIVLQPKLSMVMELVDGIDLWVFMHPETDRNNLISINQEDFSWELRYQIANDIANGLHFLQTRNPPIIHRDLRSPNIFLRKDNTAVIGDFGLAREVYSTIGGILASWQWIAPECLDSNSSEYDIRSDIYSFGVVLWELAAISMPFGEFASDPVYFNPSRQTYKLVEIKRAIIEDNLRPTIPDDTPENFASLIKKCWDKDPCKRPTTLEIIEELKKMGTKGLDENEPIVPKEISDCIYSIVTNNDEDIKTSLPNPLAVYSLKEYDIDFFVTSTIVDGTLWIAQSRGGIYSFNYKVNNRIIRINLIFQINIEI